MKRFVNLVITASLLSFGWSCQQEQLEPVVSQNEGTIEISIELADALQTKSDHDGSAVTTVWYEVYDNKSEERIFPKADSDRTFPAEANASAMATDPDENRLTLTDGKATLQFQTLKNRSYKILFWAMSGTDAPYTWSTLDNISMNYDKSGKRDAFFGSIEVLGQNTSDLSVTLQRPFALINFGAAKDEIELYNDAPCIRTVIGDEVTYHPYSGAELVFENVASAFSVKTGAPVSDTAEDLTLTYNSLVLNPGDMEGQGYLSIKNEDETTTDYVYMTASYILTPTDGTTIDMTATFKCLEDGTAETSFTYPLATVPVQANHRTNILGRIFTGSGQLSVSKMVGWEDYNKELWNGETQVITPAEDNVYVVTTAEQLAWVAQQVNTGADTFAGKIVRLGADIDLAGALWTPIGDSGENSYTHNFQGTFDGDGKTIRNMKVDHPDAGGLFGHMVKGTVRDLTIDGFEITSDHYAGAIAGWIEQGGGNILVTGCKALNGKIEVSVITKDDGTHHDLGDKAGSIVGFGYKGTYTDNVAENVEIRGYRDLGGILGYAHEATVTGNSITNVTIKQNLDIDYKKTEENGDTPTTLGDYVGRISGADNCVIENNTGEANINRGISITGTDEEAVTEAITEVLTSITAGSDIAITLTDDVEIDIPSQLNQTSNQPEATVTITGNGENTVLNGTKNTYNNDNMPGNYAHNLHLVLKNLTYVTSNVGYNGGFGHAASVTFINCKIVGQFYAHSNAPHYFYDCTIDPLNGYLYTYASDCVFERCTFNASEGKALQIYDDGNTGEYTVKITDCKFFASKQGQTWDGKPVTAIDINSNGEIFNVIITNCTATGFPKGLNSGSTLWNNKSDMTNINLTIDGVKITE